MGTGAAPFEDLRTITESEIVTEFMTLAAILISLLLAVAAFFILRTMRTWSNMTPTDITEIWRLTRSIEEDPRDAEAYYRRGLVYSRRGAYEQAIRDYPRAPELKPDFDRAYAERGLPQPGPVRPCRPRSQPGDRAGSRLRPGLR